MQIITVIGYLGGDPEMKYTEDGQAVTSFSVAVNDPRDKVVEGEKKPDPTWYRCATWGKSAEAANEYLRKGDRVCVVGSLRIRPYRNKEGFKAWSNDVNANAVEYLTPKDGAPAGTRVEADESGEPQPFDDGDPPASEPPASEPPVEEAAPKPASRPRSGSNRPKAP